MDLHFHVNHSGDAARANGDTVPPYSGSGQIPAVYMNPNRICFLTGSSGIPFARHAETGIESGPWDNHGVTMATFLLVPRYLPLWVDFRQQP